MEEASPLNPFSFHQQAQRRVRNAAFIAVHHADQEVDRAASDYRIILVDVRDSDMSGRIQ